MSQKLLDRTQICSAFQKVGGERVPERVWRDPGAARLEPQPAADIGGRQALSGLRQEERRAGAAVEDRPAAREVAVERPPGVLAHRHYARAAALALHAHLLGIRV